MSLLCCDSRKPVLIPESAVFRRKIARFPFSNGQSPAKIAHLLMSGLIFWFYNAFAGQQLDLLAQIVLIVWPVVPPVEPFPSRPIPASG